MVSSHSDRRRFHRYRYVNTVELGYHGTWRSCTAMNISLGGVFVSIEAPPPEGSEVALRLTLENQADPLLLDGMVVRISLDGGAGIGFTKITDEHESILRVLIGELEDPPQPGS